MHFIYLIDFKMHRDGKERIPGSIDNDVTGVRECSQQRSNLKDDGYNIEKLFDWRKSYNHELPWNGSECVR